MPNVQNKKKVEELTDKLGKAKAIYFTDYLGLDVKSITQLRSDFFQESIEYLVAKNTLLKLAADNNNFEGLEDWLVGPTAIAISYDEPVSPAKVLKKFTKDNDLPGVKAIFMDGEVLAGEEYKRLADMPSKEQLLSQLIAMLQSPLTKFVGTVGAPMTDLARVLNNLKENKS